MATGKKRDGEGWLQTEAVIQPFALPPSEEERVGGPGYEGQGLRCAQGMQGWRGGSWWGQGRCHLSSPAEVELGSHLDACM